MNRAFLFAFCVVSLLTGCYNGTGHMYPVQGPLANAPRPPVIKVTLSWTRRAHEMTAKLPDGEICRGDFTAVESSRDAANASHPNMQAHDDLLHVWNEVYGTTFYPRHVLRARFRLQAVLKGDRGTVLRTSLFSLGSFESTWRGDDFEGVAEDNSGDFFRVGIGSPFGP